MFSKHLLEILSKLFFIIFLLSCQSESKENNNTTNIPNEIVSNHILLDIPDDTYRDTDALIMYLDSLRLSAFQIAQFCQKDTSWLRKVQLVQAVSQSWVQYWKEENKDYWGDIHLDRPFFMEVVSFVRDPKMTTFMDVGSGNGEKLFAATCLGFETIYGLEYSDSLYQLSQNNLEEFIEKKLVNITLGDALNIDKAYYQQAHLIYMYCPIKDYHTMAKLYWRILQSMEVGTILLEVRAVYYEELKEISGLKIPKVEVPDMEFLAIRKTQETQFEYLKVVEGQKKWIPL